MTTPATYTVETGRGASAYTARYTFDRFSQAFLWYAALNTHSGHKKRLRRHWKGTSTTLTRELTERT